MSNYLGSQRVAIMQPRLPYEYQEVEYIESTGIQYIDTGVLAKSGVSAKVKLMWREISPDSALLGARNGGNRLYLLYQYPLGTWNVGYGLNYAAGDIQQDVVYETETILKNGLQKFIVNGETQLNNTIAQEYDLGVSIFLFNYNEGGVPSSYYAKARIYTLKMYENDVLVLDFIPCYRKADGVGGLYDLVERKFYENKGRGDFVKGDNATKIIEFEKRIERKEDVQ